MNRVEDAIFFENYPSLSNHLLLETAEPNLVTGMTWLLGTYSKPGECGPRRQYSGIQGRCGMCCGRKFIAENNREA